MNSVGISKKKRIGRRHLLLAQCVAAYAYGVGLSEMRSRTRKGEAGKARQLAAYLARVVFNTSLREVACVTGLSPATVSHACRTVELRRECWDFDLAVARLERQLRQAAMGACS